MDFWTTAPFAEATPDGEDAGGSVLLESSVAGAVCAVWVGTSCLAWFFITTMPRKMSTATRPARSGQRRILVWDGSPMSSGSENGLGEPDWEFEDGSLSTLVGKAMGLLGSSLA